ISNSEVVTKGGYQFSANYIIGADGATSRVRQELSDKGIVDTSNWNKNLAIAAEAYIPREEVDIDVDYPLLHFGVLNWGYGWVFPNTDRLLVGVGGLNRKNKKGFREILGINLDPEIVKGHPIPFGNYINSPAYNNILLIGDAAGTVDAITGEGIFYAQRSGELAAWAIKQSESSIDDHKPSEYYISHLEDHIHPELRDSKRTRLFIWGGPQYPRYLAMKAWFSLFSEPSVELVHGIRIYNLLRKKGHEVHESIPQL
ncbi:MAG: NAD(P)/FAD-dependent oxidoreductase, partial [Halobacteriaceae archaeon]